MHYTVDENGKVTKIGEGNRWTSFRTIEVAQEVCDAMNSLKTGNIYMVVDHGEHVRPRYDIVRKFKIGDAVSYAFNGDCYPDGTIKSVSQSGRRIVTTGGGVYYRRRQTGSWIKDGTWTLIEGHYYKQNPSF